MVIMSAWKRYMADMRAGRVHMMATWCACGMIVGIAQFGTPILEHRQRCNSQCHQRDHKGSRRKNHAAIHLTRSRPHSRRLCYEPHLAGSVGCCRPQFSRFHQGSRLFAYAPDSA
jgi:hypothetical protein